MALVNIKLKWLTQISTEPEARFMNCVVSTPGPSVMSTSRVIAPPAKELVFLI
jgi:hypothetical protein